MAGQAMMALLLLVLAAASADFLSSCPSMCKCKWSSGKQTADCSNSGLTAIPLEIHHDVQVLIMDRNYLKNLPKDVFSSLGLNHLQRVSLKDANIQTIHENAFSDLKILKEINLQGNNISRLPPQAFQGNNGLRTLYLGSNKIARLEAHQFPPLRHLRKIDLSNNRLTYVDSLAFQNLAQGDVESVNLSGNKLTVISDKTFLALDTIKQLQLHNNPWLCDCQLKSFRDYVVHRGLANSGEGVVCDSPLRMADRSWEKVDSNEFACKPQVVVSTPMVHASPGQNATLQCKILGNPPPGVNWVKKGRMIKDRTTPLDSRMGQVYHVHSVATSAGGIELNHSLTITNVQRSDLGDYSCVAINSGGMSEDQVVLTFDNPGGGGGFLKGIGEKELTIIIGVACGILLILAVLLILICCCCR